MKKSTIALFIVIGPHLGYAAEKINGVSFQCANQIRFEVIKDFAKVNKDDKEAVAEFRELIRANPDYACKHRSLKQNEDLCWCNGSGCSCATAKIKNEKCVITDIWYGQDDGDIEDPEEFEKNCLTARD